MRTLRAGETRPTDVAAARIPAQRGAPPPETVASAGPVLPDRRPAAAWGVVAGMAVGAAGTLAAAVIASATSPPAAAVVPEPRVAFAGTVSVPGRELTAFGDGTWQVGVDVVPGTYASTGGVECRHAVTGADLARAALARAAPSPGGATVELARGSGWFATSGCATWTRMDA